MHKICNVDFDWWITLHSNFEALSVNFLPYHNLCINFNY